jgi:WD40 repeat protein
MLWNIKTINQRQVVFNDHRGWVLQACFDPDEKNLVTADAPGNVQYFTLTMDYYASNLCEKVKRSLTLKEWTNFVGDDIPYVKTCDK